MTSLTLFQSTAAFLGALFLLYGMDVRRRQGARSFVAPVWQRLMKVCAFSLIGGFVWLALSITQVAPVDWMGQAFMLAGTGFVVAAKSALGKTHTFTGQYLEYPLLVTQGVYAVTRNPLYFGVFLCEFGAFLCALHQLPVLLPHHYHYWLAAFGLALLYAVSFNWAMAGCEARQLERHFGETYRRYRSSVPFLVPLLKPDPEVK